MLFGLCLNKKLLLSSSILHSKFWLFKIISYGNEVFSLKSKKSFLFFIILYSTEKLKISSI